MIHTNINFESDDEQDAGKIIFSPTTTALKAQEHLREHLHITHFEGFNMRFNTLKDIEARLHMYHIKISKQSSIPDIFQRVDDVYVSRRMMKTLTWVLVRVWLLVLSHSRYAESLDIPNTFSRAPMGLV